MAIQYSGTTLTNNTFTATTRADLINNLETALNASGWTTTSGHGTSNIVVKSQTTPQSCKIKFRLKDPGSGNCAQITLLNDAETLESQIGYIIPGGVTWRVVCNGYQFFMYDVTVATTSTNTTARKFVGGGVPWIPSFISSMLSDTSLGWLQFNGSSDTDATAKPCFRSTITGSQGTSGASVSSTLFNSTLLNFTNTSSHMAPTFITPVVIPNNSVPNTAELQRWEDGSFSVIEPLLAWATGATVTNEPRIKGMVWDGLIVQTSYVGDSVIPYDSHNWIAITNNSQVNIPTTVTGTLFMAIT